MKDILCATLCLLTMMVALVTFQHYELMDARNKIKELESGVSK